MSYLQTCSISLLNGNSNIQNQFLNCKHNLCQRILTVLWRSDGLFGIGLPLLEASTNNKRQYFAAVTYGFKWLISPDSHVQVGSISVQHVTHKPRNSHDLGCASGRFFRTLGLRFEESAKLNAVKALRQATTNGSISIKAGTKGGRAREIPASPQAVAALKSAVEIQGKDRSMIPGEKTYAQFRDESYKELREVEAHGFHSARHAWAQERYRELSGADAPVVHGWGRAERFERLAEALSVSVEQAREIDAEARMQVARELGHGRMDVTDAYLG